MINETKALLSRLRDRWKRAILEKAKPSPDIEPHLTTDE